MLNLPTHPHAQAAVTGSRMTVIGGHIVINETAVAALRRWLRDAGLGDWRIFHALPAPTDEGRRQFLRARLIEVDLPTIEKVVSESSGMSYAHLEEIVQSSGMIAVRAGRDYRTADDVNKALDQTRAAFNTARHGYAKLPEAPFGLSPRK